MGCGVSTTQKPQRVEYYNYNVFDKKEKKRDKTVDEFEERTMKPLPEKTEFEKKFKCGAPTFVSEDITPCFDNGLLYRIVKDDVWAFYNDTRNYEMHVEFAFSRSSLIRALGSTKVKQVKKGAGYVAVAVVYPTETVMYVKGSIISFKSKIKALPLSEEYLQGRVRMYGRMVELEMKGLRELLEGFPTDDAILAECVRQTSPFIDIHFPPNQDSITRGSNRPMKTAIWARPHMYLPDTYSSLVRIFRNTISPMRVDSGELGDSWLVCAIAALAEYPEMVRSMFHHPRKPELTPEERALGAYRVTLNKHGWWKNIIVDDYLPVLGGRAKYAGSRDDPCEMWISILEKAYAKVHGSYANIVVGDPLLALQDLTGYPTTRYDESFASDMQTGDTELLERLDRYNQSGYYIGLITPVRDVANEEKENFYKEAGLMMGYMYTVRAVRRFTEEKIYLLRICNPWSAAVEWKGDWNANDPKWSEHPHIAEVCAPANLESGTFWMSWSDVQRYFDGCGVAFIRSKGVDYRIRGNFVHGVPDFCVQLTVKKTMRIGCMLSQKDRRGTEKAQDEYPPIMLTLSSGRGSLDTMQVECNSNLDVDNPSNQFTFMQSRDVGMLCTLTPECSPYLLIPRVISDEAAVPYTLSLFFDDKLGGSVKAVLQALPPDNQVFANFPSFSGKGTPVTATFQVHRPDTGYPPKYTNRELTESTNAPKENKRVTKELTTQPITNGSAVYS
ncbi:calpain [Trypanosoma rangeli]|uniref:Calpain n=1 Tax=Trypanosoma rangeli TaxID=5698 RepID=A0A422MYX0_TRYRA|nr:calpain [Trypanosoma rangeli]RNE98360.1 calpain [Trypanosoma rangeli]|eukprot:RNE98360.1 calpain [Trypanosoma rangeli]